jgi:hypothetical protein
MNTRRPPFAALFLFLFGGLGLASVAQAKVEVEIGGEQHLVYERSEALLVGLSQYKSPWILLERVDKEIAALETKLKALGFSVRKTDNNLTNSELYKTIRDFLSQSYPRDSQLLVYFAGHGWTPPGGGRGYIVPSDAPAETDPNFLSHLTSMEEIKAISLRARAKHVLFIFDSCFSGSIFSSRRSGAPSALQLRNYDNDGRQFISAGSESEPVPAVSDFAPALLRGLDGEADLTKDGLITANELGYWLNAELTPLDKQTPQWGSLPEASYRLGDFIFVSPQGKERTKVVPGVHEDDSKQSVGTKVAVGTPADSPSTGTSPDEHPKGFSLELLETMSFDDAPVALSFSPDGETLAVALEQSILFFDVSGSKLQPRRRISRFIVPDELSIPTAIFLDDAGRFALADKFGKVAVFDANYSAKVSQLYPPISRIALIPGSDELVVLSNRSLVMQGMPMNSSDAEPETFGPIDSHNEVHDFDIRLSDSVVALGLAQRPQVLLHDLKSFASSTLSTDCTRCQIALSEDGRYWAGLSSKRNLGIYKIGDSSKQNKYPHPRGYRGTSNLTFSADSRYLLYAGVNERFPENSRIWFWDVLSSTRHQVDSEFGTIFAIEAGLTGKVAALNEKRQLAVWYLWGEDTPPATVEVESKP